MAGGAPGGIRWWDRSLLPYLTLVLSPLVTLPISLEILSSLPDCGIDEPWWELRHFQLALLPSLADFLPFAWLAFRAPGVRRAAAIAGLLGAARFGILQAATLLFSESPGGQGANADCTVSTFLVAGVLAPLVLSLWLASAVFGGAIWFRSRHAAVP